MRARMKRRLSEWGWVTIGVLSVLLAAWVATTIYTAVRQQHDEEQITRIERIVIHNHRRHRKARLRGVEDSNGHAPSSLPGPSSGGPGPNSGTPAPLPTPGTDGPSQPSAPSVPNQSPPNVRESDNKTGPVESIGGAAKGAVGTVTQTICPAAEHLLGGC